MSSVSPLTEQLAGRFGLGDELVFRAGPQGLVHADVATRQARASVCLQGAQLLSWQPRSQAQPVVWLSPAAREVRGKSLRGGAPVCWPWFGPHPGGTLPAHGFARNVDWELTAAGRAEDGAIELDFALHDSAATRALWPHAFALALRMHIGDELELELLSENRGAEEFLLGEALHTYFQVGDIGAVAVEGLEGCTFVDSAAGGVRGRQEGAIGFTGEFDRVYLGVPGEARIVDRQLGRCIRVRQSGAAAMVVWNPWDAKAARLGDLGDGVQGRGGWRDMVCVESANALDHVVRVAPGATHRLAVRYSVA